MRFRVRTRRVMLGVAVAAVLLATPGELRNRRARRHIARMRVFHLDLAAKHDARAGYCLASAGSRAYDARERGLAVPTFASWADEAAYYAAKAKACREAAATNEGQERAARRRLIFPVIFDIRSSRR